MTKGNLIEERLTGSIIGAFFEVYNNLGYGFLEHVYCNALEFELRERGHRVAREVGVVVHYKHIEVGRHRIDLLVDEKVVLEVKSTLVLHKDPTRQIFNYLKATGLEIGLFLHAGREANVQRVICTSKTHPVTVISAESRKEGS